MIGTRLGPYDVLSKLGEGGMGEVYRARDTKLKRDVAIKVLPDAFAKDPERLARFEREAEVLATLNHPNIAAVYGFEESADASGIVLELVEGPTLAERIEGLRAKSSGLPMEEALPIARQIGDAMLAAHEKGIIHRDLKPANIKITPDGKVKVLDFGLAKLADPRGVDSGINVTALPTITSPAMMTGAGVILGTAAYMSPEQARARPVDARADIWAFGAVLYEMLTGRRAFPGDDVTETIANIVKTEPDWSALPAGTPAALRRLLQRCLQKDPDRRLRHIADARLDLDDAISAPDAPAAGAASASSSGVARALPWAMAACALVAAGVFGAMLWRRTAEPARSGGAVRLEVNLPSGIEMFTTNTRTVALSPDGTKLAFIGVSGGTRLVYLRSLDQFAAVPLKGSDGATLCFFSPDGRSVGVENAGGILTTISLVDGLASTVVDNANFQYGAAWMPDDSIVFARGGVLWRIARSGATPKAITTLDAGRHEVAHAWPMVLPGGTRLLLAVLAGDQWRIDSLDLASGARATVIERGTLPLVSVRGRLLYLRDGEVLAAPFDPDALRVTGPATRMIDNLATGSPGVPMLDVSVTGTIVYASTAAVSRLVWTSRGGAEQPVIDSARSDGTDLRPYANPRLSPDGARVIVQAGNLWVQDLARGTFTRLSRRDDGTSAFPMWSADGRRVLARSSVGVMLFDADGSGRSEVLPGTSVQDYPTSVTADGDTLVFQRSSQDTGFDLFAMPLRGSPALRTLVRTSAYEGGARLSPDGRWLVYVSNDSGHADIYVRPFSGADRRWQVSTQGGTQPVWNPNGREMFYREGNRMMAVDVTATASGLSLSQPHVLFEQRYAYGAGITLANYDVSRDGQRFLMVKDEAGAGRLSIVLNAFADLVK